MSRRAQWASRLAAFAVALALAVPALAGTTGKLTGRVVDEKKQPLAGVNVRIEGQRLGGITDDQGEYFIIGIPAGRYSVRLNLIGFANYVAENVEITPDFSTTIDAVMRTEAVQMNEVVVNAERPLLQKDATGTTRFLSASDIQKLPTRGYRDAAAQQTGVVNFRRQIDNESQNSNTLIIRGGRPNETAYFVDGFSQQDPLTGTSTTAISNNAIEEVVLLTGGFAPEYGRIMSGAANVITREGASKYFGAFEGITDNLSGNWVKAPRTDYNVYDGSLGGPVLPNVDRLTFYVSGERRWQADRNPTRLPSQFVSQLSDPRSYGTSLIGEKGLNSRFKPNNSSSGFTYQGKLAWALSDQVNLKAGTLGSYDEWREYAHTYLFNVDHMPRYKDKNQSYFTTYNQTLSAKTFFNVGLNYFKTERKRGDGVAFDDISPQYIGTGPHTDTLLRVTTGIRDSIVTMSGISSHEGAIDPTGGGYYRAINPRFDPDLPMFFKDGHVFNNFLQRSSAYFGVQGSLSSQLNQHNQVKLGGDFQRHTLRYFLNLDPAGLGGPQANLNDFDAYGYKLVVDYRDVYVRDIVENADGSLDTTFKARRVASGAHIAENADGDKDGPKHPKTWSLYGQDKYEREGVIVNGGLRFDHIDVDTDALRSEQYPIGEPGVQGDSLQNLLDKGDLVKGRSYARLSPRLGVAFPVDEKTILRFNYGQFYQQPNLQDLYVSYRFLEYKVKSAGYYYGFGNPNLRPERTTAYEVGMQRQMGDNVRLDVTAYYKDVKDLVEVANIPAGIGAKSKNFSSFRNRDFATIKGVDIGFSMRPVNHISASMNYSLSYAFGTGSVSNSQRNVAWTASQPPKQTSPLDFDQRHKLSMNLDWSMPHEGGPMWGRFKPFQDAGVNLLLNVASGTPYTPTQIFNEVTLAAVSNVPSGPINSRTGPWSLNVDLKATRGMRVGGMRFEAYAWVLNLLDQSNPVAVYSSSGSASTTNWLSTNEGQGFLRTASGKNPAVDGESLYRLAENDPTAFSNPRLVRFGLRTSF